MKKTSFKLMLATVCALLASAIMNQTNAQQKAWSGNTNGFGIDSLNNPSTVTWTLSQGPGTGVSANAVGEERALELLPCGLILHPMPLNMIPFRRLKP